MIKTFQKMPFIFLSTTLLFVTLACNASFTVLNPTTTPNPPTAAPLPAATAVPLLSQQVTLVPQPFEEVSQSPIYTIKSQTPQLTGSDDPRVLAFNQRLTALIEQEVDLHRQGFLQNPVTPLTNGSFLEVTYTLISQHSDIWSLKLDFSFYSDGAAHPGHYSGTVNYDLGQGRELALGDLFLADSNYLEAISSYCIAELEKRDIGFESGFQQGAAPTPENYSKWNIAPEGLIISFDEYQVASYAAGPQTITIPYAELASVTDPQGPLASYLP